MAKSNSIVKRKGAKASSHARGRVVATASAISKTGGNKVRNKNNILKKVRNNKTFMNKLPVLYDMRNTNNMKALLQKYVV